MNLTKDKNVYPFKLFGETYRLHLALTRYQKNNVLALQLFSESAWGLEPFATLSVNLEEIPQKDCFWCKDWSENEWVPAFLLEHKIAKPTGRSTIAGFAIADEWELSEDILKEYENAQS